MDPVDDMARPFTDHGQHAFMKAAGAAFTGVIIGSLLDNTRFGRWFNTSRVIGFIFYLVKLAAVVLAVLYVYFVIKVW